MEKKLTQGEWEKLVSESRSEKRFDKDAAFKKRFSDFAKFVPVPVFIGGIASSLYIYRYGLEGLVSLTLSCVIAATLIATMSAAFINTIKKFFEAV